MPPSLRNEDEYKVALPALNSELIIEHYPNNHATQVPVDQIISVTFQRDIDVNSISTSTFRVMVSETGQEIKGDISYNRRVARFAPARPLDPAEAYQVVLVGESNLDNPTGRGIQDILGNMLYGNYSWTFFTADSVTVDAPNLIEPSNETLVDRRRIEFSWKRPETAVGFEVQIAKDRNFRAIMWPKNASTIANTVVHPDVDFEDGQYWWRVRAVDSRRRPGRWSEIWTFSVDTLKEGTISTEDETPPGVVEIGYWQPLEVVELFPEENASNIDLNLGAVVIKILGDISPEEVNENSLRIFGRAIAKDANCKSHGQVEGSLAAFRRDGLTYIVFQPEPLE